LLEEPAVELELLLCGDVVLLCGEVELLLLFGELGLNPSVLLLELVPPGDVAPPVEAPDEVPKYE
jgi:hypothetical protein